MARWGSVDFREFKRVCKKMEKLTKIDLDKFCKDAARELAARLLGKVIRRTPVDTGFLRQGWNGVAYARSLPVYKQGNNYIIEVVNPTEYASYVEYGHRTKDGKGWVKGQHFLTISEMELQSQVDKIIEKKLLILLKGVFDA